MHCGDGANFSYRQTRLHQRASLSNGCCLLNILCSDNFVTGNTFMSFNEGTIRENLVLRYVSSFDQKGFAFNIVATCDERVDPLEHHGYVAESLFIRQLAHSLQVLSYD